MKRFYVILAIFLLGFSMISFGQVYVDDDFSEWSGDPEMPDNWLYVGLRDIDGNPGDDDTISIEKVDGVYGDHAIKISKTEGSTTYRYAFVSKDYVTPEEGTGYNIMFWGKGQSNGVRTFYSRTNNDPTNPDDWAYFDSGLMIDGTGEWEEVSSDPIDGSESGINYEHVGVALHTLWAEDHYWDRVILGSPASITDWDLY